MIKLKSPYNGKGGIIEAGTVLSLPEAVEKNLIADGNAERVDGTADKTPPKDKTPEPTAEELIKQIEAAERVEELQKILAEEQASKSRKTVIKAANDKIEVLLKTNHDDNIGGSGSQETNNQ